MNAENNRYVQRLAEQVPQECVALIGYSTIITDYIVDQEVIPSYPRSFMHPEQLEASGGVHLYYAIPLIQNIRIFDSDLAREIEEKIKSKSPMALIDRQLGISSGLFAATDYAYEMEIRDAFEVLAFREEMVVILEACDRYTPDVFEKIAMDFLRKLRYEIMDVADAKFEDNLEDVLRLRKRLRKPRLVNILNQIGDLRGNIICLGPSVLRHDVIPGIEDDREILIRSEKLLPNSDILKIIDLSVFLAN